MSDKAVYLTNNLSRVRSIKIFAPKLWTTSYIARICCYYLIYRLIDRLKAYFLNRNVKSLTELELEKVDGKNDFSQISKNLATP